jgi:hypothetical protein
MPITIATSGFAEGKGSQSRETKRTGILSETFVMRCFRLKSAYFYQKKPRVRIFFGGNGSDWVYFEKKIGLRRVLRLTA